ncbi:hypothetical protein B0T21DRAFT_363734 [Apiosordaria backusii]|uniref:Uncharacterized protein n=1 Tax=Apiosordaria backusii TaxID=314023 RepID=A0AA40BTC4_9PEZI|nr:hypothetical protein B0T21DRAFT_363734 [Apiosordaria backusii]
MCLRSFQFMFGHHAARSAVLWSLLSDEAGADRQGSRNLTHPAMSTTAFGPLFVEINEVRAPCSGSVENQGPQQEFDMSATMYTTHCRQSQGSA